MHDETIEAYLNTMRKLGVDIKVTGLLASGIDQERDTLEAVFNIVCELYAEKLKRLKNADTDFK